MAYSGPQFPLSGASMKIKAYKTVAAARQEVRDTLECSGQVDTLTVREYAVTAAIMTGWLLDGRCRDCGGKGARHKCPWE